MDFLRLRPGRFPVSRLLSRSCRPSWRPRQPQPLLHFNSTLAADDQVPGPVSPPPFVLRDYQEECIQSVLHYLDQGHKRLGISLATGSGKTVIFTQLIDRIPSRDQYGDKTLIIVNRRELVEQAVRHCHHAYPDRKIGIEMATSTAAADADIVVATVKSLVSGDRLLKFAPDMFKLVLVDEAHHIVAPSYRTVLEHFGLNERSEDAPALVGVSATLSRLDGVKLGAAIDHIVYHKDYVSMIDEKWLANAVFTTVKSKANLSKVKSDRSGDLALTSLSKAVNTETTNDVTVRAWLAHARDRKSTLGFCVDIDHARDLTATFRNSGIDARYMTGRTPKQVRQEQLTAFKNQEFPVLFNCGLFTEGTDIPNVDCVLLARPTVSRNLLIQMIGRGLRLFPGKTNCHIIDMVASLAKVGVLSTPTLFGLHPDEALNNASLEDFQRRKEDNPSSLPDTLQPYHLPDDHVDVTITKYENIYELIKDVSLERHIRSLSRFAWVRVGDHRYVLSGTKGWISLEKLTADTAGPYQKGMYEVRLVTKFGSATESPTYTRPRLIAQGPDLESAVHSADTYAAREFEQRYIRTDMPWRKAPATENQLRLLNKSRFRKQQLLSSEVTRGQATDLITRLKLGGSPWIDSMQKRMNNEAKLMELRKREEVRVGPVPS